MSRIISLSEVKQHKNSKSCWVVIHNDVYDVTSYLGEHPGGEDALLEVAGQDGTQNFEDVGHSDDAREIMKKFKIGSLPPGETSAAGYCGIDNARSQFEGTSITVYSCDHIPKTEKPEKTWRTFDGSSGSNPKPDKHVYKPPPTPKIERRVKSIVVPRERTAPRRRRSSLRWAVLALAGAVVIGLVLKKYLATA